MSMPIQRQSEQFGAFDSGPRWARDRQSTDLPRGLAGLINTSGPRIQAGLLNTRTAVNVDGMDPDSHAYHTELPYGPGGEWIGDEDGYRAPRRGWNPDFGYEPTDEDERRHELVGEDDDSGYNWGPEPTGVPEGQVYPREARRGSGRLPFDHTAGAVPAGQQAPAIPAGGGYQIGHRIRLMWRPGSNISGTVIGLDGPNVNVRWDDGQYSPEEPRNIQLL